MSILTSAEIKSFLIEKKGYIKKSPIITASALWKKSNNINKKTSKELLKDIENIKIIQKTLRAATKVSISPEDEIILSVYDKLIEKKNRPIKRLFFDLEVSANIVFSWRIGYDLNISHDDIIKERAIICACYKWENEETVHSIEWNKGDDKSLLHKFAKVISEADEVVTQNGDSFDIKWLRTRCLYYGIQIPPKLNSIDTLKLARSAFKFNSNKLDYMGKFLNLGEKIKTDISLWKNITLHNDKIAMKKMVDYCKQDVLLLEQVFKKLNPFVPPKKFKYKL